MEERSHHLFDLYVFDLYNWPTYSGVAESEQMRREADDIGPRAERDHLTYLCDLYIWPI